MKSIYSSLIFLFIIVSCSSDEIINDTNTTNVNITSMVRKNYDVSTNSIIKTYNYSINNNKIKNIIVSNEQNNTLLSSSYNYLSDKLIQITNSTNGVVSSANFFVYDTNQKLIEYRSESYNSTGEIATISKHEFTRIQDTIYSVWTSKTANSSEFVPVLSSKIVLDQNNNRTYFESYDHFDNVFKKIISTYDSNNNMLSENYFELLDGTYMNMLSNNYTYNNSINTLEYIMNQTYGRENLMLLYHLQTYAINEINVKSHSPNNLSSYTSSFDNELVFSFSETTNNSNYSTMNEYKTFISNLLFTKFTFEYTFD